MNLMNPRITVQNAEGEFWLVTITHQFNEVETVTFTVSVAKSTMALGEIQQAATDKIVGLLQKLFAIPRQAP